MAVDYDKAKELRQQGSSYADIAKELNCSIAWCKSNLKDIIKNIHDAECLRLCMDKALSKDGITDTEIRYLVKQFDSDSDDIMLKRIKRQIKQNNSAIIRPYWLQPNNARQSLNSLLMSLNSIEDRINDEINLIRQELNLDKSYTKSIAYALFSLSSANAMFSGIPLDRKLDYLHNTVDKLMDKNNTIDCVDVVSSDLYTDTEAIDVDSLPPVLWEE